MWKASCFFHVVLLIQICVQYTKATITVDILKPRKILPAQKDSSSAELEERVKNGFLTALAQVAERKGMHMSLTNKYGEAPFRDTMRSLVNSLDQHRTDSDERIQDGIEAVVSQNWDFYFTLVGNKTGSPQNEYYDYQESGSSHRRHYGDYVISEYERFEGKKSVPLLWMWVIPGLVVIAVLVVAFFFAYRKNRPRTTTTIVPRIVKAREPRTQINDESTSQMEEV